MNEDIRRKLANILKKEASQVIQEDEEISIKANKITILYRLYKILDNYDELEPILIDYFSKKSEKDKWERS